jgi:hypothetical protein
VLTAFSVCFLEVVFVSGKIEFPRDIEFRLVRFWWHYKIIYNKVLKKKKILQKISF